MSALTSLTEEMSTLTSLIEEMAALKAKFRTDGKAAVHTALKELFDAHPTLERISWTQYTPYFNDGAACTFSSYAGAMSVIAAGKPLAGYDDCGGVECDPPTEWFRGRGHVAKPGREAEAALVDACQNVGALLDSAPELLETVFGDHVTVIVTREGIETEYYDHE